MASPKPKTMIEASEDLHRAVHNLWTEMKPLIERPAYAVLDVLTRLLRARG